MGTIRRANVFCDLFTKDEFKKQFASDDHPIIVCVCYRKQIN